MSVSSERFSGDDFLVLNHCGIEHLNDKDHCKLREKGRVDYLILYIVQGRCYTESRTGDALVANTGDLVLFMPGERQKYAFFQRDDSVCCYIHFTGAECEKLLKKYGMYGKRLLSVGSSHTLYALVESMAGEHLLQAPYYDDVSAAHLLHFLSIAGRRARVGENKRYSKHKSRIDMVCKEMLRTYMLPYTLEDYAGMVHLSVSRFAHLFRECMGVSPHEYLLRIRIDNAKILLLNTELTVSEVAERCGFSSQNYFAYSFKVYVGVSPSVYMKG